MPAQPSVTSESSEDIAGVVAANLKDMLKNERWSARHAAAVLGLTPMYVSRRVSGEVECTASDLALFAGLLHVSVDDFYAAREDAVVTELDTSKTVKRPLSDYSADHLATVIDLFPSVREAAV